MQGLAHILEAYAVGTWAMLNLRFNSLFMWIVNNTVVSSEYYTREAIFCCVE